MYTDTDITCYIMDYVYTGHTHHLPTSSPSLFHVASVRVVQFSKRRVWAEWLESARDLDNMIKS